MSKQTAMQALVDLLKVKDTYKECMPYIIEIIDEVYLPMEKKQIVDAWDLGRRDIDYPANGEQYYDETYKGGEQ